MSNEPRQNPDPQQNTSPGGITDPAQVVLPRTAELIPEDIRETTSLEEKLGYIFQNRRILDQALSHGNYQNAPNYHGDELRMLGETIIKLAITELLFRWLPEEEYSPLAHRKDSLYANSAIVQFAHEIDLPSFIRIGSVPEQRESVAVMSNAFKSVFGAVYVDLNYSVPLALDVARAFFKQRLDRSTTSPNPRNDLSHECHVRFGNAHLPQYETVEESGGVFHQVVKLNGTVYGSGSGSNKKAANKIAAGEALRRLKAEPIVP